MSDIDGDSTMHSSPEFDPADDDEMFPDEAAGPSTPRNASGIPHDLASELSPPNSQGPTQLSGRDEDYSALQGSPSTLNVNGKRVRGGSNVVVGNSSNKAGANVGLQTDPETGYSWSKQEEQPGWEWKNSRAREEEARALEAIIDKGIQIKTTYGDPLDASVPAKSIKKS